MRLWLSSLLIIFFGTLSVAASAADVKPFTRDYLASDAVRLVETLRREAGGIGQGKSAEQLRREATGTTDYKLAARFAAAAVTANLKDAANWLTLARVAIAADDAQASMRWYLREEGATAAYAAYERLADPKLQAEALALLGNLMARREMWRPALDAYRASLDRRDDADTQAVYEDMREKHGFRITDYKVDNDSAAPRVCFQFSDPLARKTDFTPYVAVSGATTGAISTEDQQLCVEGLKHGERYAIVIRQGLPSTVGNLDNGSNFGWSGAVWNGSHASTLEFNSYSHVVTPNSNSCDNQNYSPGTIGDAITAGSNHPGGVNVTFADGSVHFIKDSVAPNIWWAVGSRNGGEVISADALY